MSETRDERTYHEQVLDRAANVSTYAHIHKHTVLEVHSAHRDEDRVVLQLGDDPGEIMLFFDGPELERLHDVVHEALAELGHTTAGNSTHEAYAAGWDAALAFVQTTTEGVPTDAPVVPIGVG